MKERNEQGTTTLSTRVKLKGISLKGISMTKMNPVNSSVRPLDGGAEKQGLSTLVVATLAIAALVIGGGMFYSLSGSPPTTITSGYSPILDDFESLDASQPAPTPPTTTGQRSR